MLSYYYRQQPFPTYQSANITPYISSLDGYRAALAAAEATEQEYLRERALEQEELALQRRLEQVRRQKEEHNLLRFKNSPRQGACYRNLQYHDFYPGCDLSFVPRRRHSGERTLAARQAQLREEAVRQQLGEQLARINRRQSQQELIRQQQPVVGARRPRVSFSGCLCSYSTNAQCTCTSPLSRRPACGRMQPPRRPQQQLEVEFDVQPLFESLLGYTPSTSQGPPPKGAPHSPKSTSPSKYVPEVEAIQSLLEFFLDPSGSQESLAPSSTPAAFLKQHNLQPTTSQKLSDEASAKAGPERHLPEEIEVDLTKASEQLLGLFTGPFAQATQPQASSPSSPSASSSKKPYSEKPEIPVKGSTPASKSAETAEHTLKKELEARLNNEYEAEVRDTIQAIIASLQDDNVPAPSSSEPPSPSSFIDKGKSNVVREEPSEPTSKDVVTSLNEVSSIETAFATLESDFTFPAQLDFNLTNTSSDASSIHSSDSESSATSYLAYTSRNHPVRFYEQALGSLLSQLDAVPSFGNEELRKRRKEAVSRVGKALDRLEWEVKGRWRSRLAREAKFSNSATPAPATAPEAEAPANWEAKEEVASTETIAEKAPEAQVPAVSSSFNDDSKPSYESVNLDNEVHVTTTTTQEVLPPVFDVEEVVVPAASDSTKDLNIPDSSEKASAVEVEQTPSTELTYPPSPSDDRLDLSANSTHDNDEITPVTKEASVPVTTPSNNIVSLDTEVSEAVYPPAQVAEPEPESGSSSVATIKPQAYEVADTGSISEDDADTFLLPSSNEPEVQHMPRHDDDSASDWSEVEA